MGTIFYLFFLVFVAFSNSTPVQKATRANPEDYRLPDDVIGDTINYDLELTLGSDLFESNTFTGNLELIFSLAKNTSEIKIHAGKYLFFPKVSLMEASTGGKEITLTNSEFRSDSETEILTISTFQNLVSGIYKLNFVYTAALITDEMYGLYKSYYKTKDGDDVPLATTQFQATYARRVFPCFDEPSFKATFEIKITHLTKYTALGNTVGTRGEVTSNSNFTTTTFKRTPKMSTYLIAFVVSDFTCDTAVETTVPHRICSRDDAKSTRALALDYGPKLLDALHKYTGVPYGNDTINKIDQAAIPDFAAGAMENWGLATYRETALLWNEQESSNRNKQRVVTVVSHELAHMWFGDLVTTHWWSDTFLNEGFATFFEYFAAHEVNATITENWELDKQFVIEQVQSMLQVDSLQTSRPLSWPAFTPSEVSSRFGSVSYNKGGSIIRMVQHMMGTDKFKEGLTEYLNANALSNVVPTDLWTGLQESASALPSDKTLENVMENWVRIAGYPLLNVTVDGSNVVVTQQRFYTDDSPLNDTERWFVPITYTRSTDSNKFEDTSTKLWFSPDEASVNISLKNTDWIILNNQQVGYYRILYDDTLWEKIVAALAKDDFDGITDLNRAQLVDDIYNFAKTDLKTHTEVLNFYGFLKQDTSYYTWYAAFTAFQTMLQRTGNQLIRNKLGAYILNLMESLLEELPFATDKDNDQIYTLNKVLALTWACRLGQEACINSATAAFKTYRDDPNKRPSKNLRAVIYCNALRNSNRVAEDWTFLWDQFLSSELATEQTTILSALGCAKDTSVLTDYLEKSINASSGIRQQDALSVFSSVYSNNPEGIDIAFDFLIANYKRISAYYGSMNSLSSLINGLSGRFTNQGQVDKLENFLEDNADDLSESLLLAAGSALESAKVNIKLTEEFEAELRVYFYIKEGSDSATSLEIKTAAFITTLMILTQKLLF